MTPDDPRAPRPPRPRRTWSLAGVGDFPVPGLLAFIGLIGVGYFVVALLVTAGIATWGEVETSTWEQATELARLFGLFWVVWLIHAYLAAYVAHGVTRREFMARTVLFVVAQAALLAALVTAGYLAERLVFELADWPQALTDDHAFGSPTDVPAIFAAYGVVFLVWGAVGAMGAAGFYRDEGAWGLVAVPVGVLLVMPSDLAVDAGGPPFVDAILDLGGGRLGLALVLCVLSAGLALAGAWALLRDVAIRSKTPVA